MLRSRQNFRTTGTRHHPADPPQIPRRSSSWRYQFLITAHDFREPGRPRDGDQLRNSGARKRPESAPRRSSAYRRAFTFRKPSDANLRPRACTHTRPPHNEQRFIRIGACAQRGTSDFFCLFFYLPNSTRLSLTALHSPRLLVRDDRNRSVLREQTVAAPASVVAFYVPLSAASQASRNRFFPAKVIIQTVFFVVLALKRCPWPTRIRKCGCVEHAGLNPSCSLRQLNLWN